MSFSHHHLTSRRFNGRTLFIKFADPQTTGRAMADRLREILPSKYDESNKVLSLAGTADIPLNGVTPNYNTEGFVKSLFMAIVAKIPEVRFGIDECGEIWWLRRGSSRRRPKGQRGEIW